MSETAQSVVAIPPAPAAQPDTVVPTQPLNPCELEIDLFCKGIRIDPNCALEQDARFIARTRAGLGSGLDGGLDGGLGVAVSGDGIFPWGSVHGIRRGF